MISVLNFGKLGSRADRRKFDQFSTEKHGKNGGIFSSCVIHKTSFKANAAKIEFLLTRSDFDQAGFTSNFIQPLYIWWEELVNPVWLITTTRSLKMLKLHISHYRVGKSKDVRVHSTVLEMCDSFWIVMVAPKSARAGRCKRACLSGGTSNR